MTMENAESFTAFKKRLLAMYEELLSTCPYEEWLHTTQAREATAAASVPAATAAASVPAPSSLDGSNRFVTLKAAVPPSWLDANALAADAELTWLVVPILMVRLVETLSGA